MSSLVNLRRQQKRIKAKYILGLLYMMGNGSSFYFQVTSLCVLTFITYHHVQKSYGELSIFRTPYTVEQKRDSIYVMLQLIKMKINFLQVHNLSVLLNEYLFL